MICSIKSKFLCCFPLLSGCFIIGVISSLTGTFLLYYTLMTLPLERLGRLNAYYYCKFMLFLTTLAFYYVGITYAGFLTMYGVLKRKHTKLLPLFVFLIAHPFMAFSYNYVYATDWNRDHYTYSNTFTNYPGTPFFERNGAYIFIIGLVFAAYSAFCIYKGIKMIENNQNDEKTSVFDFKFLKFSTFFGVMPLEVGGLVIGVCSIILGIYFLISMIARIPDRFLAMQDSLVLTIYYSFLALNCIFYIALIIGGILMMRGVFKKNYDIMKPLMIVLTIQPAMVYFFYEVYSTNSSLNVSSISVYIVLTILCVYSALCIKNVRRIIKIETMKIVDSSYAKLNNHI